MLVFRSTQILWCIWSLSYMPGSENSGFQGNSVYYYGAGPRVAMLRPIFRIRTLKLLGHEENSCRVEWDVLAHIILCVCAQSCLTLPNPMDCSLLGASVQGISQARILGWVAIFSSRGSFWPRDRTHFSCIGGQTLYHWATWEAITSY